MLRTSWRITGGVIVLAGLAQLIFKPGMTPATPLEGLWMAGVGMLLFVLGAMNVAASQDWNEGRPCGMVSFGNIGAAIYLLLLALALEGVPVWIAFALVVVATGFSVTTFVQDIRTEHRARREAGQPAA
jgi:hypothetical protein